MTNALRPAPPKAADGASAGVITPRGISRRKILGATVDGQFGAYILSRRSVTSWGRAAKWTRFAPTQQGVSMNEQGDTYDDYMAWAAFYAEQADAFRRTEAATWHDKQTRTWFIRDKQNTAAAWARAAEALRQQAQP